MATATIRSSNPIRPSSAPAVRSFGEDRTCTASGCDTRLSRYNPDDYCFVHREQVPPQRIARRWHT
jgi:hypothetical protein